MRTLIENATVLRAVAQNPKKKKMRKIRTISRYERKRTAYKLRDLTEKLIRTIAVAIAILVGRESQLLREEALRHVRTEVGPRTEIEIDHGIDRETGHEIDREIDHATDHAIETGIEEDHWIEIVTEDGSESVKGSEKEIDWIGTAAAAACGHLLYADHLIDVALRAEVRQDIVVGHRVPKIGVAEDH